MLYALCCIKERKMCILLGNDSISDFLGLSPFVLVIWILPICFVYYYSVQEITYLNTIFTCENMIFTCPKQLDEWNKFLSLLFFIKFKSQLILPNSNIFKKNRFYLIVVIIANLFNNCHCCSLRVWREHCCMIEALKWYRIVDIFMVQYNI